VLELSGYGHRDHQYPGGSRSPPSGKPARWLAHPAGDQELPELETYLEGEVANGETGETRLPYNGLCFLKELFARSPA